MECIYKFINGNFSNDKEFSEAELAEFLLKNYDFNTFGANKTFSANREIETLQRVEEMNKDFNENSKIIKVYKNGDDYEEFIKIENGIGVSKLAESAEDENAKLLSPKFDEQDWRAQTIAAYETQINSMNTNEKFAFVSSFLPNSNPYDHSTIRKVAEMLVENEVSSWQYLTGFGTLMHKVFEVLMNEDSNTPIDELNKKLIDAINKESSSKFFKSSENESLLDNFKNLILQGHIVKEFSEFKSLINSKHPGATIFTEQIVKSDNFNPIKDMKIDSVWGIMDLLIIDKNGKAHIYDFKVSKKLVGNWSETQNVKLKDFYHSTKKRKIELQMSFYKAMLEQRGIPVESIGIIPINIGLSYENKNIKSLDTIKFERDRESIKIQNLSMYANATSPMYRYVKYMIPNNLKKMEDEIYNIKSSIVDPLNLLIPNTSDEISIQARGRNLDSFLKNNIEEISHKSNKIPEGSRFKFFDTIKKKYIYGKTQNEIEEKAASYIDAINASKEGELSALAKNIKQFVDSVKNGEKLDINDISGHNSYMKGNIANIFGKYLNGSWDFIYNDEMNSAGIFLFAKDSRIEVISLSNNDLTGNFKINGNSGILGNFINDRNVKDFNTTNLSLTYSTLASVRALLFINNNSDILDGAKINSVKSANIWTGQSYSESNDILLENMTELITAYNLNPVKAFGKMNNNLSKVLNNAYDSYIEMANMHIYDDSIYRDERSLDIILSTESDLLKTISVIESRISPEIKSFMNTGGGTIHNPSDLFLAWIYLRKALLADKNIYISLEKDPKKYLDLKNLKLGINLTSIHQSDHNIARALGEIYESYSIRTRDIALGYFNKTRPVLEKTYKANTNKLLGNHLEMFEGWFLVNGDKIDSRFALKPREEIPVSQRELYDLFLKTINELKFGDSIDAKLKIAELKDRADNGEDESLEYYQVPLVRAYARQRVKRKGIIKSIKDQWTNSKNLFEEVFEEQESEFKAIRESNKDVVFNMFRMNAATRRDIINSRGIDDFSMDIEKILNAYIIAYAKEESSKTYLPIMNSLKIAALAQHKLGDITTNILIQFIDEWMKVVIDGDALISDEFKTIAAAMGGLKGTVSLASLGFNPVSGIREIFQGTWTASSRVASGVYGNYLCSYGSWVKAYTLLIKEYPKSYNNFHKLELMNMLYGMSNAGIGEMNNLMTVNQIGLLTFGSNQAFYTNKAPDILHRMGFLIGKMIDDGSFDAHYLNEDGELVYDFKKDKRFSVYSSGQTHHPKYKEQRSLYLANLEQLNREGFKKDGKILYEGDDLPRAYTSKESMGIRNLADLCFGHYDKATAMLWKNTLLGGMLTHYRTFLTAKIEQWTMSPGKYNVTKLNQQYDHRGVKLVRVYLEDGNFEIKPEDELQPSDEWDYVLGWDTLQMEGIIRSMWDFTRVIGKMDQKQFNEYWKDPVKRGNLKLFIHDMIILSILMNLVEWIIDNETYSKMNKPSQMIVKGLDTSFQDGNIFNIVGTLFGDLNPPAHGQVMSLIKNSVNMITKPETAEQSAFNMFGITKPFLDDYRLHFD